jgi:hypothetical protein
VQVLAKEIIHSRKAVGRLYVNKAQMISIGNALTEQLGETQARGIWGGGEGGNGEGQHCRADHRVVDVVVPGGCAPQHITADYAAGF